MTQAEKHDAAAFPEVTRVERMFSRIGLALTSLVLLIAVLLGDLWLTRHSAPVSVHPFRDIREVSMNLVTSDGRGIGGIPGGVELSLSPGSFYENRPRQKQPDFSINSLGLRGAELDTVPRRPRVIVIEGSAAFGLGVRDHETFVAVLQAENPEWEILNAGVVGYLAQQELALVVFKLIDLRPSLIIAFNGWNDAYDNYWWSMFGSDGPPHPRVNVSFLFMENRLVDYRSVQTDSWFALQEFAKTAARNSTLLSSVLPRYSVPAPPPPGEDVA